MPRAQKGAARNRSKNRIFRAARGQYGSRSRQWKRVKQAVTRSQEFATAHRRERKGEFRRLWTSRINAAVRERGLSYNRFMQGLRLSGLGLNRKMLSEVAIHDPKGFDRIVEEARSALDASQSERAA